MVDRLVNSQVNSRRLLHVEQCFGKGGMPLNVFGRVLVGEGVLVKMCRKKPKQRQFFLFNDYLVYGNIVISKKRYNKQRAIPLENVKLENLPDEGALKNGWIIKTPQKSFAVFAATLTEKQEWMIHIERSVAELLDKGKRSATEHAPVWVPDGEASVCMACKKTQFTLVQRRHHCRACGSCVCGNCSTHSFKIDAQKKKPVRCYTELSKVKLEGVLTQPVETIRENSDSSTDSEEEEGKEDSKMEIPPSSLDPEDITYSYKVPNDSSLWGPYCYSCMERWNSLNYFSNETPIFIHAEKFAVPFGLDRLIEVNGSLHPFTFERLKEPVRVLCCSYEGCPKDRSVSRATSVDTHKQSETEEFTTESIQEYPLLARWTPRSHDTTPQLTGQERSMNDLLRRMSETNLEKPTSEDDYETPLSTKAVTLESSIEVVDEAPCCSTQFDPPTPVPSSKCSCRTIEEVCLPEEKTIIEREVEIDGKESISLPRNAFARLETKILERDRDAPTVRYNARQISQESSSASNSFERLEFPETQRPARRTEIAIQATSVESCSSVLKSMEPEPSEETELSDCDLSPSAMTVSHMHFLSSESDILAPKELATVSSSVYKAARKGRKCFKSTYPGLKPFCTPTCYVCGFQAMCCCEYTLHVFSPTHINLLNVIQTPVSRTSFNFWLWQLAELRSQSPHPFIALELKLSGPPVLENRLHAISKMSLLDIPRISHPPVSCRLVFTPTTLAFMNANSPSNDLPIECSTLSLLARVITVHYSNQCFQPAKGCPFIRHYCPSVCRVCFYKSNCACHYIFHLFGAQHVDALKRNFIKITMSDIRFWLRHLESFSNREVNWRMRPVLQPIVSNPLFIPPSQYPQYALPIYHVYPPHRPVNTDNGCSLS